LRTILNERGFTLGEGSLSVDAVDPEGRPLRLALKGAGERYIGFHVTSEGGLGPLETVDAVALLTFNKDLVRDDEDESEQGRRLQVLLFDASPIREKARQQYARLGHEWGWLPLDVKGDNLDPFSLKDLGRVVYEADVEWVDEASAEDAASERRRQRARDGQRVASKEAAEPLRLTIAEAKRGLAAYYGVPPDNIEIIMRG